MLTPTVDRVLVALKAIVDRNYNSHRWQDSGTSERYCYSVKKVEDPPEIEMRTPISHSATDPHVRGNNIIHCVGDPQLKGMKAVNSFESYGCLTADRELEF